MTYWFGRLLSIFVRRSCAASKCGHKTKRKGLVCAFGEQIVTEMPLGKDGQPEYCLECLGSMAIRCGGCGRAIFIGDPVALLKVCEQPNTVYPSIIGDASKDCAFVSCMRVGCVDSGAMQNGVWEPPGRVKRIPSAFELLLENPGKCASVVEKGQARIVET